MTEQSKLDTVEKILDGKLSKCDRCKTWVEGEIRSDHSVGVYKGWTKCLWIEEKI